MNLTDAIFNGIYRGKTKHAGNGECTVLQRLSENLVKDDLEAVMSRAHDAGVGSMVITGTSLDESRKALELARKYSRQILLRSEAITYTLPHLGLYATVGCHPTHTTDFEAFKGGPNAYLQALEHLLETSMEDETRRVVSIGECGLGGFNVS